MSIAIAPEPTQQPARRLSAAARAFVAELVP